MPEALSTHPEPYQHEWRPGAGYNKIATGWSYPPKDYARFAELVYQWVKHCVERYGRAEVEHWYFEVWNESNISSYWHGTPEELYKLHDYAVDAVRRALPTARVGGPDMAGTGGRFMENFMKHVVDGTNYATGKRGTPTDFLSFHAKGAPGFVDGHVRLGIAAQLRTIDQGFAMIANVPELKNKPIVIGESDPDGCAACQGPQLGYRNTTMYSSYTAATFAREHDLAARRGVNLDAALTWAFEFENQPFFSGQRTLANNGIDLPVMNVFRMFSRMSGQRIEATSSEEAPLDDVLQNGVRGKPDVGALASLDAKKMTVLTWYYHDDDLAGPDADIEYTLNHLPLANGEARLTQYRIDRTHSNAFTVWQEHGLAHGADRCAIRAASQSRPTSHRYRFAIRGPGKGRHGETPAHAAASGRFPPCSGVAVAAERRRLTTLNAERVGWSAAGWPGRWEWSRSSGWWGSDSRH